MAGSFESLRIVLDNLEKHGGAFCYRAIKCHLITSRSQFERPSKFLQDYMLMLLKVILLSVQLMTLIKKCNNFMKQKTVNLLPKRKSPNIERSALIFCLNF